MTYAPRSAAAVSLRPVSVDPMVSQSFHGLKCLCSLHGVAFCAVRLCLGDAESANDVNEPVAFTWPYVTGDGQCVDGLVGGWFEAVSLCLISDDGHVECIDVVADECIVADEGKESPERFGAVWCPSDVFVGDSRDPYAVGWDRESWIDELAEFCHRFAMSDAHGPEFDDSCRAGIQSCGFDVDGGVVVRHLDSFGLALL